MQAFQQLHAVYAREPDVSKTREGSMESSFCQKLSASGNTMAVYPSSFRMPAIVEQIDASSSTIQIGFI